MEQMFRDLMGTFDPENGVGAWFLLSGARYMANSLLGWSL